MIAGSFAEKVLFYANRRVGHLVPWGVKDRLIRVLYPPDKGKPRLLTIDIVGGCNLRCPSCPVGNMPGTNPAGLMDLDLFEKIIRKGRRQHGARIALLYNWTEPLLHPRLPEFIRLVKREGMVCCISSNLNISRNLEDVVAAEPDSFRISLSGFTQEAYGISHVRGDIERVKENMRLLSNLLKRQRRKKTVVSVHFHKYLHNVHEVEPMRNFVRELGFEWLENWAYLMPLEKAVQLTEGQLGPGERDFVEKRFALPIAQAIAAAEQLDGHKRCTLLEDQLVIDHRGNLNLCCTVFDLKANRLGTFLEMDEAAIAVAKTDHPTCRRCGTRNLHLYFTYYEVPELKKRFEELAEENVRNSGRRISLTVSPA
jgi:MoaA/NifB/PqqE/SkfB family radical SAM enzyme